MYLDTFVCVVDEFDFMGLLPDVQSDGSSASDSGGGGASNEVMRRFADLPLDIWQ